MKLSGVKTFSNETSERYALALFELANENSELEKIEKNIIQLLKICLHNQEFKGPEASISQEIDEMKYRQKDESFDQKIKRIRSLGIKRNKKKHWQYDVLHNGLNLRLNDFQCALGLSQLKKLSVHRLINRNLTISLIRI